MYWTDLLYLAPPVLIYLAIYFRLDFPRYPPGPRGTPWLGNSLQIPKDRQWLTFSKWAQEYGPVMRIKVLGQSHVVLSSFEAVEDLFESRGNIYSDRPPAIMAGELVGWDRGLGYTNHNARFRDFRKLFHTYIGPRACSFQTFQRQQEPGCLTLVQKLVDDRENFCQHPRGVREILKQCPDSKSSGTSGSILGMLYGYATGYFYFV